MSSQIPEDFLDPNEYPVGSQKRQEKERELEAEAEANRVPESEWRKTDNGSEGEG